MKIYIVEGSTGEYSDHCEWAVKAFVSEQKAKDLVTKASEVANEIFACSELDRSDIKYVDRWKATNPFDLGMQMDYNGTRYKYYDIELDEEK